MEANQQSQDNTIAVNVDTGKENVVRSEIDAERTSTESGILSEDPPPYLSCSSDSSCGSLEEILYYGSEFKKMSNEPQMDALYVDVSALRDKAGALEKSIDRELSSEDKQERKLRKIRGKAEVLQGNANTILKHLKKINIPVEGSLGVELRAWYICVRDIARRTVQRARGIAEETERQIHLMHGEPATEGFP